MLSPYYSSFKSGLNDLPTPNGWHSMHDTVNGTARACSEMCRKSYCLKNGYFFHFITIFEPLGAQIVMKIGTHLRVTAIYKLM